MYRAKICITQRKHIPNPAGRTVENALHRLGFSGAKNVRIGKYITLDLEDAATEEEAMAQAKAMSEKLFVSSMSEEYEVEVEVEVVAVGLG